MEKDSESGRYLCGPRQQDIEQLSRPYIGPYIAMSSPFDVLTGIPTMAA